MQSQTVSCVARSCGHADQIVERLKDNRLSDGEISVLFAEQDSTRAFAHAHRTRTPSGSASGSGGGVPIGGAVGWLLGMGALLVVPGFGPLVAVGPLLTAFGGAAVGGALGAKAEDLTGLGVPLGDGPRLQRQLKEGGVLISVNTEDPAKVRQAYEVFRDSGARDISSPNPAWGEREQPRQMNAAATSELTEVRER